MLSAVPLAPKEPKVPKAPAPDKTLKRKQPGKVMPPALQFIMAGQGEEQAKPLRMTAPSEGTRQCANPSTVPRA